MCDNLAVTDGTTAYGVAEPLRIGADATAPGARPGTRGHGRRERPWGARPSAMRPDAVVVVRRGDGAGPGSRETTAEEATRALVAGTFTAGELRRFWPLCASLALATGRGPALPAVEDVARSPDRAAALPRPGPGPDPGTPCARCWRHRSLGSPGTAAQDLSEGVDLVRTTAHGQPIEVAQVVTRCIAGAGGVALRGALHLDPERYRVTFVTGEGGPLTDRARDAGMRVLLEPSLVPEISPRDDRRRPAPDDPALRRTGLRRGAHAQREGGGAGPVGGLSRPRPRGGAHLPRLPVPRLPESGPPRGVRRGRAGTRAPHRRDPRDRHRGGHRGAAARAGAARLAAAPSRRSWTGRRCSGPRRPAPRRATCSTCRRRPGRGHGRPGRLPEGARAPDRRRPPATAPRRRRRLGRVRTDAARDGSPRRLPGARRPVPLRRRARRRRPGTPGLRRLRDGEPLRGAALRCRGGDAVRPPGGRDGRELGAGPRRARRVGAARPAGETPAPGRRPSTGCWTTRPAQIDWPRAGRPWRAVPSTPPASPRSSTRCTPASWPPTPRRSRGDEDEPSFRVDRPLHPAAPAPPSTRRRAQDRAAALSRAPWRALGLVHVASRSGTPAAPT